MRRAVCWLALLFLLGVSVLLDGCGGSSGSSDDAPYTIAGRKSLAVVGEDGIPVEPYGFITMNASSGGNGIIAGAAHGNLYYSADGGSTWWVVKGLGVQAYWTGAAVSGDGRTLAVAGQKLYVSHDAGETWTVYPFVANYDGSTRLRISSDGVTLVKAGENLVSEVDVSHDSGANWIESDFIERGNLAAFALSSDGRRVAAVHYGKKLVMSTDGGLTWRERETGELQWQDVAMSPDGTKLALLEFGVPQDDGSRFFRLLLSGDGGDTWSSRTVDGIQGTNAIAITDSMTKILVTGSTVGAPFVLSSDGGETWETIPAPANEDAFWPRYAVVFTNSGERIIAMEEGHSLWTSDDRGQTWRKRLQGNGAE